MHTLIRSAQRQAAASALAFPNTDGWIPFDHFMALALTHPTHGYYSRQGDPFGGQGDFITAPMLGSWLAGAIVRAEPAVAAPDGVFELGAGRGDLAADLLLEARALGIEIPAYQILETSSSLAERQAQHIRGRLCAALGEAEGLALAQRVSWPQALPRGHRGLVLANEVADALPVKVLQWQGTDPVLEWGVAVEGDGLAWRAVPAAPDLAAIVCRRAAEAAAWGLPWRPGHRLEVCPSARAWADALAGALDAKGALLLIDYGYEQHELDHPERAQGTLAGHRQHRRIDAWDELLAHPGEIDLTAHVNFSVLAEPMLQRGMAVSLKTQAAYLLEAGVLELAQERLFEGPTEGPSTRQHWQALSGLQTLLGDTAMGQSFLVLSARPEA